MKKAFLAAALLTACSSTGAFAANELWNELNATQQASVLAGQQVLVDTSQAFYWEITVYARIQHLAPLATPRGSMAVYWDLPGQVSYQPALVSIVVTAGQDTAAVKATVTALTPGPSGPTQIVYKQENTVFQIGNGPNALYTSSFQTKEPSQPIAPFAPFFAGDVSFQSFPGDGGGALIKYRAQVYPIAPVLADPMVKGLVVQQVQDIVTLHTTRMAQGASVQQIVDLERSLR